MPCVHTRADACCAVQCTPAPRMGARLEACVATVKDRVLAPNACHAIWPGRCTFCAPCVPSAKQIHKSPVFRNRGAGLGRRMFLLRSQKNKIHTRLNKQSQRPGLSDTQVGAARGRFLRLALCCVLINAKKSKSQESASVSTRRK